MEWDPLQITYDHNRMGTELPPLCLARIRRDLKSIIKEPPPGIFVTADESNISLVHALIIGPPDTPYEKGFFYFVIGFPMNYPITPPKVKLMTTGGSRVRFNPNIYKEGKVCLSILNTWSGPAWSPANSLTSVLLSIQSLLNDMPYHNEPGYEFEVNTGDVKKYNDVVQHETLRVAVVGMMDNDFGVTMPPALGQIMQNHFLESFQFYEALAERNANLSNTVMQDPFGTNNGLFQYNIVLARLRDIQFRLEKNIGSDQTKNGLTSSSIAT